MIHQFWSVDGLEDAAGQMLIGDDIRGILRRGVEYFFGATVFAEPRSIWITDEETARLFQKAIAKYKGDAYEVSGGASGDDVMASRVTVRQPIVDTEPDGLSESGKIHGPCITYFQFPSLIEEWGLKGASPRDAAAAIAEYERLMGVEAIYKPSGTGLRAIRGYHAKIGKLDNLKPPESGLQPFEDHKPQAILWVRDLFPSEQSAHFIHAYDKRASYLHAADVALGVGDWYHVLDYQLDDAFTFKAPGVWRLRFYNSMSRKDVALGRALPAGNGCLEGWFYSPMVRALRDLKYPFEVMEGYYFSAHKQILKHWREVMLAGMADDASYLRKMIKATYTRAIGLMGSETFSRDTLYRPDWRGQIVDEAGARMLFNIQRVAKIGAEAGKNLLPVAVYDDCLYYVSDSPSPYAATPILTEGGNLSAKFQHKGTAKLDDEVRALLAGTPAKFSREIKRLMERDALGSWIEERGQDES